MPSFQRDSSCRIVHEHGWMCFLKEGARLLLLNHRKSYYDHMAESALPENMQTRSNECTHPHPPTTTTTTIEKCFVVCLKRQRRRLDNKKTHRCTMDGWTLHWSQQSGIILEFFLKVLFYFFLLLWVLNHPKSVSISNVLYSQTGT